VNIMIVALIPWHTKIHAWLTNELETRVECLHTVHTRARVSQQCVGLEKRTAALLYSSHIRSKWLQPKSSYHR
jgi:hypothetical protein